MVCPRALWLLKSLVILISYSVRLVVGPLVFPAWLVRILTMAGLGMVVPGAGPVGTGSEG
jgi:hypothetical protein